MPKPPSLRPRKVYHVIEHTIDDMSNSLSICNLATFTSLATANTEASKFLFDEERGAQNLDRLVKYEVYLKKHRDGEFVIARAEFDTRSVKIMVVKGYIYERTVHSAYVDLTNAVGRDVFLSEIRQKVGDHVELSARERRDDDYEEVFSALEKYDPWTDDMDVMDDMDDKEEIGKRGGKRKRVQ